MSLPEALEHSEEEWLVHLFPAGDDDDVGRVELLVDVDQGADAHQETDQGEHNAENWERVVSQQVSITRRAKLS